MGHVTIIAEFGSSPAPYWDFEPWCAAAAMAGADAVKVQLFRAEHFPESERASKQPLAFPRHRFPEFVRVAHAFGLVAGASVFDLDAVSLAAEMGDFLKLAAREQGNDEIRSACLETHKLTYRSISHREWTEVPWGKETLLWAMQSYPAPMLSAVWRAWQWGLFCRRYHPYKWGWSSHTTGTLDCVLAVRLGASVIEKHLSRSPDDLEAGHSLALIPFTAMCRDIRKGER